MTDTVKIRFCEPNTGIWVEGETGIWVDGWCGMMNAKIRLKKALAAKYGENVEVECREK